MRLIGTLEGRPRAELFVAYLYSQRIRTVVEPQAGASDVFEIWVCDEDQVSNARHEFEQYRATSDLKIYEESLKKAEDILRQETRQKQTAAKNIKKVTYRTQVSSGWPPPITLTLVIISTIVSLISNFGDPGANNSLGKTLVREMLFVDQNDFIAEAEKVGKENVDPAISLKKGQLWRAVTPVFLHLHAMHLLFNMLAVIQLGRIIERMEGPWRYGLIILLTAIIPNLLQGLMPEEYFGNPIFAGMSGIAFGLFGFLWVKTSLQPEFGMAMPTSSVVLMLAWLVMGFTGALGPIANLAHLGGLLTGMLFAWLSVQLNSR